MTTRTPHQHDASQSPTPRPTRRQALTESQSAYAQPQRSTQAAGDDAARGDGSREVRVRSNYQTKLGDVANAADADARAAATRGATPGPTTEDRR